jgi:hypothetical protein
VAAISSLFPSTEWCSREAQCNNCGCSKKYVEG